MFRTTPSSRNTGFSLMELMIVVAIIGILSAVAFPSYQNSVIKGNRANAKAYLMDVTQRQQQFLLDNRSYAVTVAALNAPAPTEFSKFYDVAITLTAGPPPGFEVKATPKAGSKQVKDGWLQITNTGAKSSQYPDKW